MNYKEKISNARDIITYNQLAIPQAVALFLNFTKNLLHNSKNMVTHVCNSDYTCLYLYH